MSVDADQKTVFVVDDDVEFAQSVEFLLASVNLPVTLCENAEIFLEKIDSDRNQAGCVLLDVRMPGMSGLQVQKLLVEKAVDLPVIIMTAHGDVDMAVEAMKNGAMDFIQKPFNDQKLIDLINKALQLNLEQRARRQKKKGQRKRLEGLTQRENEVLALVVEGNTNKEVAHQLGISDKTVEVHRSRIMEKTGTRSIQELMKLVFVTRRDK